MTILSISLSLDTISGSFIALISPKSLQWGFQGHTTFTWGSPFRVPHHIHQMGILHVASWVGSEQNIQSNYTKNESRSQKCTGLKRQCHEIFNSFFCKKNLPGPHMNQAYPTFVNVLVYRPRNQTISYTVASAPTVTGSVFMRKIVLFLGQCAGWAHKPFSLLFSFDILRSLSLTF